MLLSHLCAFAWANTVPTVVMSNAIGISFHHFSNELSVSLFFHSKEKFSVTIFFCSSFLSYKSYICSRILRCSFEISLGSSTNFPEDICLFTNFKEPICFLLITGSLTWIRQDPGFPDALFKSNTISPNPGIEIKAWFPFATEITARFKDSITIFSQDNIDMALIAWLPENVIWGKPKIIDVLVVSGKSVAEARDAHYHRPPDYLVFEPEDTSNRTSNLQQTNTNGYKLQTDKCDVKSAIEFVEKWGESALEYSPTPEYQQRLRSLYGQFVYRLDTNYAKIDRIEHKEIEKFKTHVLNTDFHGMTIKQWSNIFSSKDEAKLEYALKTLL